MDGVEAFSKHKNKLLNIGVIILAIFAASKIYSNQNRELSVLTEKKAQEIKKNTVLVSISQVEKRTVTYKQFFQKKELGEIVELLSNVAKEVKGVQILSVKSAGAEERGLGYAKAPFAVSVKVADYHALGEFVSKLENYKDLYLVEEVIVNSTSVDVSSGSILNRPLIVGLKIITVSYL